MTKNKWIAKLAIPALALLALGGCATNFRADVARFQQLPAPQGQSFSVVADDPSLSGGIEFGHYAGLVANQLAQEGFRPAAPGTSADLTVRLAYSVDNGREKVRSTGTGFGGYDPFYRGGFGYGGGFYGRGFVRGFYDPFLFGGGFGNDVTSYTVYTSALTMKIERSADGQRLFEGTAKAQSLSNRLTYLVPNLVEAMFTNFPGASGEEVRVTIAPEPKGN